MSEDTAQALLDWETEPMPQKRAEFRMRLRLSPAQRARLQQGHLPQEMEDHWLGRWEDGRLCVYRSWTGYCIFIVRLGGPLGLCRVTVNRDPKQYTGRDVRKERRLLSGLLRYWAAEPYMEDRE